MEKRLDLKVVYLFLIISTVAATYFLPILPKDETRYLSVAWEMYSKHSFLLPLINGEPYTQKPPLLFWLIIIFWKIWGVSAWPLRLIPLIFSLLNLFLVKKIANFLWPEDEKIGDRAAVFLGTTFLWIIWSFLIMFDMILTFWVLLAIYGLLCSIKKEKKSWPMVIIGGAGGILTKGPVALLHIVIAATVLVWTHGTQIEKKGRWWAFVFSSLIGGILICGLWVVPACIKGGEIYCHKILWTQTIDRIQHSFAHKRPIWWYLPLLPILFFPWSLYIPLWKEISSLWREDKGILWSISWFSLTLICFSLISCKQIHYLLPILPALALTAARSYEKLRKTRDDIPGIVLPIVLGIGGIGVMLLPLAKEISPDIGKLPYGLTLPVGVVLLFTGILLFRANKKEPEDVIKIQGVINLLLVVVFLILFKTSGFSKRFDLTRAAMETKRLINRGKEIVFIDGYNDEFGFLGRIDKKIVVIPRSKIIAFGRSHPSAIIVDEISSREKTARSLLKRAFFHVPYKNKTLIMCMAKKYAEVLKK